MRLELVVDGRSQTVEVDLATSSVLLGGVSYPFRVVDPDRVPVEIEIAGERLVIEGWPPNNEAPVGRVVVNGEVVRVERIARTAGPPGPTGPRPPASAPRTGAAPPADPSPSGAGTAVRPPMPGKILEVRVKVGEVVAAGQVLLVLEAMKMKNEVASPAAGTVTEVAVAPGASVRAADVLLRIAPA